ncbi:phosphoglucosamine mutase [Gammaproteobacteria bacterium]|nr:phosphoglucosamine mutase [Gammaproteobacteria bacterium]
MVPDNKIRKYFGTDGIRGRVGTPPINAEFILKLGWAIGVVLSKNGSGKVLIGKDTRISGYIFESALEAGLASAGIDIHLLGPMPTPAVAYLTRTLRAQAGIVISASHNPFYDNGIKFFSSSGIKLGDDLELSIENQLEKEMTTVESAKLGKATRIVDAPGRYIELCKSTVSSEINLNNFKIVIDCANGATYQVAPNVFRELGAEVIEIGVKPDGLNINLDCGATNPNLLRHRVIKEKADLGIALDGDGDRVIMVDHEGSVLDGDEILYIIAKHKYYSECLRGGVVGTYMTNLAFEKAMLALGIPFVRVPVGDRFVAAELLKRSWSLGGESSGHIICSDFIPTGDGIISALQVLSALCFNNQTLKDARSDLVKNPQVLINIPVTKGFDLATNENLQDLLKKIEKELGRNGRLLIRPSGTESVLRVMVEGEDQDKNKYYANMIIDNIKKNCRYI